MNKSILCLTILIIGLALSIGVASASENTDTPLAVDESQLEIENTELSKEDNTLKETQTSESEMNSNIPTDSKLEVPQNNPTLNAGEGTFAELQELIENNYDGTIVLNNSYSFNTDFNPEGITITSQITIDGNNNVLDGKNLGRIFNITGENVILKNIKFINGKTSGNGGAIHWINSNVNIINCTFESNNAYDVGGANYFNNVTNVNIINCTFENNRVMYSGGANYFYHATNVIIIGNFNDNHAWDYNANGDGGANYFVYSNNINITGNFTNNHADFGGANYFDYSNNINITGNFTNNRAQDGGGANYFISSNYINISGEFNNNNVGEYGGANCFRYSNYINITGNFNDNHAWYYGGANYFGRSNYINISGEFNNNNVWDYGGANCFEYSNYINISGEFNNNEGYHGGANYFSYSDNVNISGEFNNNSAGIEGNENYFTNMNPKLNAYFKDSIIYEKEALLIIEIKDGATGYISVDNVNENTGIRVSVEEAVNNGINMTGLKTGTNIFKISYGGDETFDEGECYALVIVKNTPDGDREVADMEVSLPADVKVGDIVIMNVTLPGDATGTVTVFVNGKKVQNAKLENGKANIPIEGLASGNHTISITYSGNNKYLPTTSENMNLIISKVTPTITVKVDDIKAGEIATITVNVPEDATGIILVDLGVAKSCGEIKDGKAIINIPGLAKGTYTVNAMLQYDPKYCDTNITGSFEVIKDPEYFIKVTMVNGLQLTAVLTDEDGNSITNAVVSYIINDGKAVNVTTNDKGEFVCDVQSNSIITMSYVNGNVSCSESIIIKNMALTQKQTQIIADLLVTRTAVDYNAGERGTKYYFYLKDKDGNALANKEIQIGVVGKIYKAKTDANGRAGIDISIANANSYTYALTFIGDSEYAAAFAVSELKIVKKLVTITPAKTSYSFKASAKTKTVAATLKSTNSYIPKGKQVTLTIAGKTFKATVGAKGQISFNIGSITKKGTYKVDVKFAGTNTYAAANSKTITIKIA